MRLPRRLLRKSPGRWPVTVLQKWSLAGSIGIGFEGIAILVVYVAGFATLAFTA